MCCCFSSDFVGKEFLRARQQNIIRTLGGSIIVFFQFFIMGKMVICSMYIIWKKISLLPKLRKKT
jgi:hypothetical protein